LEAVLLGIPPPEAIVLSSSGTSITAGFGMKIRVLGSRGEIDRVAPRHRKHSGVLIDDTLLFDLGEPEFLDYGPEAVFITHLHPDHAFFISRHAKVDIPVYAPEPYQDRVTVREMNEPVRTGDYAITPLPTEHSLRVRSAAYLVRKGSESVLYTGDMIALKDDDLPRPVDLVITEGSYIRRGGLVRREKETGALFGHAGIPDLVRLFSPITDHILLVHFGNWFYNDIRESRRKLQKIGKDHRVIIHVGYDGMKLDTRDF
jgi:ribonuclease BN (tRNA processing enzyme)